MADSKISALSAITSLAAADQLAVAHSGASNSIRSDHMPGFQLDYVETTSTLTVTATAAASADTWIDGNAITFDGSTRVKIEAWSVLGQYNVSGTELFVELYDGSTDIGILAEVECFANVGGGSSLYGVRFLTPSNASHTYHVKAWKGSGSGSAFLIAGAGGTATRMPSWYRITVA